MAEVIEFSLDGEQVRAPEGETLLQTARRLGIAVPSLCYQEGYRADGNCRACVVGGRWRASTCALLLPPTKCRHGRENCE